MTAGLPNPTGETQRGSGKGRYLLPGLLMAAVAGVVGVTVYPQVALRISAMVSRVGAAADHRTTVMRTPTLVEANEAARREAARQTSTIPAFSGRLSSASRPARQTISRRCRRPHPRRVLG